MCLYEQDGQLINDTLYEYIPKHINFLACKFIKIKTIKQEGVVMQA